MQGERTLAGRYSIGRRVGRGGMAEVYAATDERLGRRVAVKLLHTNLATEAEFRTRFRQEAQAAARMTHPTIVRVFDAGEDTFVRNDGFEVIVPYIVMEFIDGVQLRDAMSEGRLSDERIAKYMSGLLTSLEYSHRAGVVHRDIKPGNVMITRDDEVKVTDFGIARAISDTAGTIAQTTAILGTASYFSPEQARGETVDGRSDLYSAGVVLYEMLTGRVPFMGDSAVAVAYQHVTEPPVPASRLNPAVSPALDAVVQRALAKRREDRYQTAAEFRADLMAAFDGVMPAHTRVLATAGAAEAPTELFGPGPSAVDATESALNAMRTDDDRAPEVQRRPPAMWIWGAAALVAAVIVGVLVWVSLISNEGQLPDASVSVPDVVGLQREEAISDIEEVGLRWKVETQRSEDVEVDAVISTNPPAGASVAHEHVVTLTVSAGPSSIAVPDIAGMSEDEAKAALEDAGLRLGTVTSEDSPSVPAGEVIRSNPAIGRPAAPDSAVDVFVSNGKVTLPDLRGMSLADAEEIVGGLGLMVVRQPDDTCVAEHGQPIVNMSVPPGQVDQRSQVGLAFCTGEEAPDEPDPGEGDGGDGGVEVPSDAPPPPGDPGDVDDQG
ncbi:MAG: Stk1 family PASTA domain-containing Ser/Thr kinase [Microbacteriaceae bacterium]|nr:Stk1 family PASTA domain-containing Ser/Thr kinase [Microbacteriaceae bacterium]